jgi:PAS domain S-box-containing protein
MKNVLQKHIDELLSLSSESLGQNYSSEQLRYIGLFTNLDAGIVVHASDTSIISSNPKASELLGLTEEQMKGKSAFDPNWKFLHQDGTTLPFDEFPVNVIKRSKQSMKDNILGVNRPRTNDIVWLSVNGFPLIDTNQEIKEIVISFINITKRIEIEKSLRDSEIFLRETQKIAKLGTYVMEIKSGNWTSSELCDEIMGIGENFNRTYENGNSLLHPDWQKLMSEYFQTCIKNNDKNFEHEYKIIRQNDKAERWMQSIGNIKYNENNEATYLVATLKDITNRKELELHLIKAKEKAEENEKLKSAFLQNMSHEIRTPMNAIVGFSRMLERQDLSDEKRKSFSSIIVTSSNQLLAIVTDILTISSIDTNQEKVNITKVNINEVIIDLLSIFQAQLSNHNVSLFTKQQLSKADSEIYTDKTKIIQILTNLIANALKFTHDGYVEFGYVVKNNMLEFYVKDTGIGIESNKHDEIFKRFRQANSDINRKYGGTGLGLSISKGFTELLGGKIWINSEPGKGSCFYFTIPYKPVTEPKKRDVNDFTIRQTLNILIAEDEEINFLLLEELLNNSNCKVTHAKDGQEAIDMFKSDPDIDLVLMDIKMPVMDGYTAAKAIKSFNSSIPIIAQSGFALDNEKERFNGGVFNDYITKPIDETELKQTLKKYIHFT